MPSRLPRIRYVRWLLTSPFTPWWRFLAGIIALCTFSSCYILYTKQFDWSGQGMILITESIIDLNVTGSDRTSSWAEDDAFVLSSPVKSQKLVLFSPVHSRKFQQTHFNCRAIFSGDKEETKRAATIAELLAADERNTTYYSAKPDTKRLVKVLRRKVKKWSWEFKELTTKWYLNATKDCDWFKQTRGYITSSLTQEEEEFPLAFSMLVFKDFEMAERLLRTVYRPQNLYCIHVDSKADPEFYTAFQSLASCFPGNVRMSSRRVNVTWGTFTVLEPELICMKDLWDLNNHAAVHRDEANAQSVNSQDSVLQRKRKKWTYFINLTGQEFPLKTNYEIVGILKAFKGANSQAVRNTRQASYELRRIKIIFFLFQSRDMRNVLSFENSLCYIQLSILFCIGFRGCVSFLSTFF